jgi:uncharacterized membrane protein
VPGARFSWGSFGVAWLVAFVALLLLDGLWLGWLARDFYKREIGALMADSVRLLPAALFYLLYPLGLVALALVPAPSGASEAIARCAIVGLVGYGTYDLSNFATLRGWSAGMTAVDIAWGTFASALAGTLAWAVALRGAGA